jgi:hypothetical protein
MGFAPSWFLHGQRTGAEGWNGNGRKFMTTRKYDAGKKPGTRPLIKMHKAAYDMVEARADDIAIALMVSVMKGNTMSAELLFKMAEAGVDVERLGLGPVVPLAERLSQEPQVPAAPDEDAGDGLANT